MRIAIHVARGENETAAQLKRILPELMLPETSRLRAFPCLCVISPQQVKKISRLQTSSVIGLPFFVDQQWKFDASLFPEQRSVVRISQADSS